MVNALALRGEEGRDSCDKQRGGANIHYIPLIPNGQPTMLKA